MMFESDKMQFFLWSKQNIVYTYPVALSSTIPKYARAGILATHLKVLNIFTKEERTLLKHTTSIKPGDILLEKLNLKKAWIVNKVEKVVKIVKMADTSEKDQNYNHSMIFEWFAEAGPTVITIY